MTELRLSGSTPAGGRTSHKQLSVVRRPSPFRRCKLPVPRHLCHHPEDAAEHKQIPSRLPTSDKLRVSSTKQDCPLICCWSTGEEEPSAESTSLRAEIFYIDSPLSSLPFHYKWTTKQHPHRRGDYQQAALKGRSERGGVHVSSSGDGGTTCRSSKGKKSSVLPRVAAPAFKQRPFKIKLGEKKCSK